MISLISRGLLCVLVCAICLLEACEGADPIYWTAWTSGNDAAGTAQGQIALPGGTQVGVQFTAINTTSDSSVANFPGLQLACDLPNGVEDWWTPNQPWITPTTPNSPTSCQAIRISGDAETLIRYTVTFDVPVLNPIMAVMSLGSPSDLAVYVFNRPFTLLKPTDFTENRGGNYFGCSIAGDGSLHGVECDVNIQFQGTFSSISWTQPDPESWTAISFAATVAPGVDCEVSEWEDSGSCSVTCGTGLRTQTRHITQVPSGSGATCPALERQVQCVLPPCGSIIGDPQFVGLRGQSYQVHGVSGEVYNIVSDPDLQYNSRFVFLDSGDCPVVNGKKQKGCFSHPGSYLGELGLKTRAGDKVHIVSGQAKRGFAEVTVNGKPIETGETVILADNLGAISLNNTHTRVSVHDARRLRSHGLLGQTWRSITWPNALKYVEGAVDDYVIRESDVFGDQFVFNKFN